MLFHCHFCKNILHTKGGRTKQETIEGGFDFCFN